MPKEIQRQTTISGKKPKIKLGFKYVPQRYDDDPEIAAKAPKAFKDTSKKPKMNLGFTYNEKRYDDNPDIANSQPKPFDE